MFRIVGKNNGLPKTKMTIGLNSARVGIVDKNGKKINFLYKRTQPLIFCEFVFKRMCHICENSPISAVLPIF